MPTETDRPLNIAFFTETYKPTVNGVVTAIDTFAQALREKGHTINIIGPNNKGFEEPGFIGVRSFPVPVSPDFRVPMISPSLFLKLDQMPIDIVHSHSPALAGLLALSYAKHRRIPKVQTYHAMISEYARIRIPKFFLGVHSFVDFWDASFLNQFDQVTAPTPYIADYIHQISDTAQVTILPTGIDLTPYQMVKQHSDRWHLPVGKKIVGCLARLAPEKNLSFILDAFCLLYGLDQNTHLFIIGGGAADYEKAFRKDIEKHKMTEHVTLTGMINHDEIPAALSCIDLFAYACQNDTQGLVVLEAMAAGKPLTILDHTVFTPYVDPGKNGYLLPMDSFLFARKMHEILMNPELARSMGEHSRVKAQSFSIDAQADKLISVYRDLLAVDTKTTDMP